MHFLTIQFTPTIYLHVYVTNFTRIIKMFGFYNARKEKHNFLLFRFVCKFWWHSTIVTL